MAMKPMHILVLAGTVLISPAASHAQVAGTTLLGVTVTELQEVTKGWSVKRTILGQPVYNDNKERVGTVDDLIVTPEKAISYAIVNAGGFLGLAKHNVAIPVSQFKLVDNKLVLPGATKEALKASPEFQYAQ
jgi:sporulation protein YlmC with PRC-barrel domain